MKKRGMPRYYFVRENEKQRIYWDRGIGKYVTTSRKNDLYADDDEILTGEQIVYGESDSPFTGSPAKVMNELRKKMKSCKRKPACKRKLTRLMKEKA